MVKQDKDIGNIKCYYRNRNEQQRECFFFEKLRFSTDYSDDKDADDKNGSRVVPSNFQMSMDNTTMTEIYPYGGLLAYIKYHYIDGVTKQSLMLMDKTRIVYNYKEKSIINKGIKDEKEMADVMSRFGIGTDIKIEDVKKEIGD